ncbi:MAG TPA: preprotein translocase subunit YajC [Pseudolysinimonas sp.]|nr:preprotein translocase subunit YajC [Pseudolysinimonas sp.]
MITTLLFSTGGGDDAATTGGIDSNLLLNLGLFALLAVVIIFMFRSSRKRRADAEKLQTQMLPGVEVMTQHGIFGTLVSIDDDKNEAVIETTPGTRLRVHRQTLARIVEPEEAVSDADEPATEASGEPEYGQLSEEPKPKRAPRKKPTE